MSRLSISTAFVLMIVFGHNASATAKFVDLTAEEYKGPDSDLTGLGFSKFGVGCDENGAYNPGEAPAISWQDQSGRGKVGQGKWGLQTYVIHFRVKDRHGNVIHEEDFAYNRSGTQGPYPHHGKVFWSGPDDYCLGRDAVILNKKIDLSFVTIEFWPKQLKWMNGSLGTNTETIQDKAAFTIPFQRSQDDKPKK